MTQEHDDRPKTTHELLEECLALLRDPEAKRQMQELDQKQMDNALDQLRIHTDPREGSIPDLVSDPEWANEYMAIRVTEHGFGIKFACNSKPEEVYLSIRNDRKINPDAMYYLYKPAVPDEPREGLLIGGTLQ